MSQGGGGQTPMGYGGSQNGYGGMNKPMAMSGVQQFDKPMQGSQTDLWGLHQTANPLDGARYGQAGTGGQYDSFAGSGLGSNNNMQQTWNPSSPGMGMRQGGLQTGGYSPIPQPPTPPTNGGFTPPYQMPIFPAQQNTSEGWWSQAGRPAGGFAGMGGQASQNDEAMRQRAMGGQQPQMSAPYSQQAPQTNQPMPTQGMAALNKPMQQPQQSFEQFAQTLNGSGMTSGQMQDAYQKSIQPASTQPNFWGNVGPGGTQNPFPGNSQPFPSNWGQQTFGFDPKSMAGKTVGKDMGWYYGQDAIGRNVNNQGNAVPSFGPPADGFQRRRPWMG